MKKRRFSHQKTNIFLLYLLGGLLLASFLLIIHVGTGKVLLTPQQVLAALFDQTDSSFQHVIVWELRLPRTLIALLAGAMLGLAGAIIQALTRNPLADPGIIGVSSGGILLIVITLTYLPAINDYRVLFPLLALAGGSLTALLIYSISWQRGTNPLRLVLIGILLGAIFGSVTSLFLLQSSGSLSGLLLWMVGSLNGRVWIDWNVLWPWGLIALPSGLLCAGLANALQLGDEIAAGLGLAVERTRILLLIVALLLTAGAISIVGGVSFIGLIGPHLARRLIGTNDARRIFPLSAVLTACILLLADIVATTLTINPPFRAIQNPTALPVGAVTTLLGAPFFLYLLRKNRHNNEQR